MSQTAAPGSRRRALLALVLLALALTAAVVLWLVLASRQAGPTSLATPATSTTPDVAASDNTPTGTGRPAGSATPGRPALEERTLGDLLVPAAGPFVSSDLAADGGALEGGVAAAFSGSFTDGRDVVTLRALDYSTPEAAASAAAAPPAGFRQEEARQDGEVGQPVVGRYVYYERDDEAAVRWTNGPYLLELTGQPAAVRAFYLAYPL